MSHKALVARAIVLRPKRQTTVMVSTHRLGLMDIQPREEIYAKQNIVTINGIVEVRPNVEFKLFVVNYDTGEYHLAKKQIFSSLLRHAVEVVPTSISLMKIIGVIEETSVLKDVTVEKSANYSKVFLTTAEGEKGTPQRVNENEQQGDLYRETKEDGQKEPSAMW